MLAPMTLKVWHPVVAASTKAAGREPMKNIKEALEMGHVDPRSAVGQKFTQAHRPNTPEGEEYRKLN